MIQKIYGNPATLMLWQSKRKEDPKGEQDVKTPSSSAENQERSWSTTGSDYDTNL